MSSEIIETSLNWDHETGEIVVSTRRAGVAAKLERLGLKAVRDEGPTGYKTFKTTQDNLRVGFRAPKKLSEEQREKVARRLATARKRG